MKKLSIVLIVAAVLAGCGEVGGNHREHVRSVGLHVLCHANRVPRANTARTGYHRDGTVNLAHNSIDDGEALLVALNVELAVCASAEDTVGARIEGAPHVARKLR